jgi:hypothetical protein
MPKNSSNNIINGDRRHTTDIQRRAMISWLEIERNFKLITGGAVSNASVVAGTKLKKTDGFKEMCEYVNQNTGAGWDWKTTRSRFESYLATYKRTVRDSNRHQLWHNGEFMPSASRIRDRPTITQS